MSAEKLQLTQRDEQDRSILRSLPFQADDEPKDIEKAAASDTASVMDRYRNQLRDAMREMIDNA